MSGLLMRDGFLKLLAEFTRIGGYRAHLSSLGGEATEGKLRSYEAGCIRSEH